MLLKHPSALKVSSPLEALFKPPSRSSPLQAPFKPPSSPLEAPFKPPSSRLEAPFSVEGFKPPSSPLQAPFKSFQAPLKPSEGEAPFKPSWRVPLKGALLKTKPPSSLKGTLSEGLWNLPGPSIDRKDRKLEVSKCVSSRPKQVQQRL